MLTNSMLFFHVVGAVMVFASVSMMFLCIYLLYKEREVTVAKRLVSFAVYTDKLLRISVIILTVPGLHLAGDVWGWNIGWINVSIGIVAALCLIGLFVTSPRLKKLQDGIDPILYHTISITFTMLFVLIFLMTSKPTLTVSLTATSIGVIGGLVLSHKIRKEITY